MVHSLAHMPTHLHTSAPICPHVNDGCCPCDIFWHLFLNFVWLDDLCLHSTHAHLLTSTFAPLDTHTLAGTSTLIWPYIWKCTHIYTCTPAQVHLHVSGGCWACGMFWIFYFYFDLMIHILTHSCTLICTYTVYAPLHTCPCLLAHAHAHLLTATATATCSQTCFLSCTPSHPWMYPRACVQGWTVELNYHKI